MSNNYKSIFIRIHSNKPLGVEAWEVPVEDPFCCALRIEPQTTVVFDDIAAAQTFVSALNIALEEMIRDDAKVRDNGCRESGLVMIFESAEVF